MRVLVIINRNAKKYDEKLIGDCLISFKRNNVDIYTFYPNDVPEFMSLLNESSSYDLVVIGGGDGTVGLASEVLIKTKTPFTIIPIGRGNTFYKVIYKDINPIVLFKALSEGFNEELLDVGYADELRSFILGVSLGFIPDVILASERFNFLGGRLAYLMGTLSNLFKKGVKKFTVNIIADDKTYYGDSVLVSVGLVPYRAGKFKLFPNATLKDDLLDLIVIPPLKRLDALNLLRLSTRGEHIKRYNVVYYQASEIKIEIVSGSVLSEIDGDIIGVKNRISIHSLHSLLKIAVPSTLH